MPAAREIVFRTLRDLLATHGAGLRVASDTSTRYCLEAPIGPATLAAWGGKIRRPVIPIAWVEHGKTYVSYHLMGVDANEALLARISPELRARMQGKTCFNFSQSDPLLFAELDEVTAAAIGGLRRAGFVVTE